MTKNQIWVCGNKVMISKQHTTCTVATQVQTRSEM